MLCAIVVAAQSAIAQHILESNSPVTLINTCPTGRTGVSASSEYSGCEMSGISSSSSGGVFYSTSSVRIIVSDCYFTTCYTTDSHGGVFYISIASLDINKCVFRKCSARGSSSRGGVVYQTSASSSLSVTNSTADGCYSGYGGGVFQITGGNATVKDGCLFTECYVEQSSGAVISEVSNSSSSFVTFMNSRLLNCKSKGNSVGGVVWIAYGNWRISRCEFENCESPSNGGAVYQYYESIELRISDCLMKKCLCKSSTWNDCTGGAVQFEGRRTIIERTIFQACESSDNGGAIGTKSRTNFVLTGTVLIRDCEMIDCKAGEYGGALYFAKSTFSLTLDRLVCFACYGSGTKGLSIYISSISEFTWTRLCVQGSGSLVYSVKNQPSSSDLKQCSTDTFTASVFPVTRTGKNNYVLFIHLFTSDFG